MKKNLEKDQRERVELYIQKYGKDAKASPLKNKTKQNDTDYPKRPSGRLQEGT